MKKIMYGDGNKIHGRGIICDKCYFNEICSRNIWDMNWWPYCMRKGKPKDTKDRNQKIIDEVLDGKLTLSEIANRYGLKRPSVTRILNENGIKRHYSNRA